MTSPPAAGALGPSPLPTFHGEGCICNHYSRTDCPAAATPEGQRREQQRIMNRARLRVVEANEALQEALREQSAAVIALDRLERAT